ncbi:PREDICTED: uncharacterized protein LOC106750565 isoform X2 [Dinoponera quadriceps]|uniref:Uncharacterized protein LOC106750565 isoform X2 n=1 Tax=Dinoponera quadriceps TaxID=609295 RepID=A0A6P3Y7Z7_DINQU|nr:PREDICTED: uncharacterized protein LOC106750565 isoform X2 [Dinoponera quadriceps]
MFSPEMESYQSSSLKQKNPDKIATSRLLKSFGNLMLRNYEQDKISFSETSQNNEAKMNSKQYEVPVFTPPSIQLVVVPNAPLKPRNRVSKIRMKPRRLSYSDQDTVDNESADGRKKSPQKKSDTKEIVLRNKLPQSSNKENQDRGKPRNRAEDKEKSASFYPSNTKQGHYSKDHQFRVIHPEM